MLLSLRYLTKIQPSRRDNSALPAVLDLSAFPTCSDRATARASSPTALPALPHSATAAAIRQSPHTESPTLAAATPHQHNRLRRAHSLHAPARPWTSRHSRCGAWSPAAHALLLPTAAVAPAAIVHD